VEEFDEYYFVILRTMLFDPEKEDDSLSVEQISIVFGQNFVLSFQEKGFHLFDMIRTRLAASSGQRLRQNGADYLAYRLIDVVVDKYFIVLEKLSEKIEETEEKIMSNPTAESAQALYYLKHEVLVAKKAIWPMREVMSHFLQCDNELISSYTRVYLRDVYDHIVQAIDATENFRDVLSSMMDIHLTGLTNRMNEIMKVLTIIATIFIPITFIASVYGMNFNYMPELHYHWGYFIVLGVMFTVVTSMLVFFRRRKWI
jgi:magnesium transporter